MKKILLIIPLLLLTLLLSTTETKGYIAYTYPSLDLTEDYTLTIVWDEIEEEYIYPEYLFNDFSNVKSSDMHNPTFYMDYASINNERYLIEISYTYASLGSEEANDHLDIIIYHDMESYKSGNVYRSIYIFQMPGSGETMYREFYIQDSNWDKVTGESFEMRILKKPESEPELTYQDGYDKGYIDGKNDANQNNPGGTVIVEDESWIESNWYYIPISLAGLFILKVMFFSEDTKVKSTRKKKR